MRSAGATLVHVALILVLYLVARRVLFRVIDLALERVVARHARTTDTRERGNHLRTLQGLSRSIAGYGLFFVLTIMLLDAVGANVTGVLTTAGVGGIAIGFGAQRLVRDVISGFFLIVEDQFAVGEYVTIGGAAGSIAGPGATGIVEDVGMRVTRLRDDEGKLWTLANGDITAVVNHVRAPIEHVIEVAVAAVADVAQARALIDSACESVFQETQLRLRTAPHTLGVSAFDSVRTVISIGVSGDPAQLPRADRVIREAVLEKLVSAGVPLA